MPAKCLKCYAKLLLFQKIPGMKGNWIEGGGSCPYIAPNKSNKIK